jgi:hypothetical protein
VANAGLKVVMFSAICRRIVRAAGKGVTGNKLTVESLKVKAERERQLTAESSQPTDGKDNAEALRAETSRREGSAE